jgi:hypothetical protein
MKMPDNVDAQRARLTKPDKAARDIVDGMERHAYRVLIGSDAKLVDFLYRLNPRRAAAFIAKQIKEMLPS